MRKHQDDYAVAVTTEESLFADSSSTVHSVERALRILTQLASSSQPIGVNQLSRDMGMHRATVSRLLGTLLANGFVARDAVTERYTIGLAFIQASTASFAKIGFLDAARSLLQHIAEDTGETATISVRDRNTSLTVDQVTPDKLVVNMNWIGMRTPLHGTSDGKVFLAWMTKEEREKVIAMTLEARTPNTLTDPEALERELEQVRQAGYARAVEELEIGLSGVAAPVRNHGGAVIASISISGPSYRMSEDRLASCGEAAKEACRKLESLLGSYGFWGNGTQEVGALYGAPSAVPSTAQLRDLAN